VFIRRLPINSLTLNPGRLRQSCRFFSSNGHRHLKKVESGGTAPFLLSAIAVQNSARNVNNENIQIERIFLSYSRTISFVIDMTMDEAGLLKEARNGNEMAFLALYQRHRSPVYRFVTDDNSGQLIFVYEVEASKSTVPNAINLKLKPMLDEKFNFRKMDVRRLPDGGLPTIAAIREFRDLQEGARVELQILKNPQTNEIIYDVLRPIKDNDPGHEGHQGVSAWKPNQDR
jgi:hypothetical protein